MLRLSSTVLEEFRKVCETEYAREEDLIASIKGEPGRDVWQMRAGWAFHRAMEGKPYDAIEEACTPIIVKYGDFWFSTEQLDKARKLRPAKAWVREFKRTAIIGDVELVAKVDLIVGADIHDFKARFSPVGASDYDPSLQWRSYLHVHEARSFTYHLFEFYKPDGGNFLKIDKYHSFTYWPYSHLEAELAGWISRFKEWAAGRELIPFLEKRHEMASDQR